MRNLLLVIVLLGFSSLQAKEEAAPPAGLKVLTAGHSFHVWMPPLVAEFGLRFCFVFLMISALSFLGLGIQPPQTSWGLLISYGAETMEEYPWLLIFPGLALTLSLFALNFLGDGLRDALDPRTAKD